MEKRVIRGYQDFYNLTGNEVGISRFVTITQEQIDQFSRATLDHQWIHSDPVRAASESPYRATIAHGYLTLSLLTHLWYDVVDVRNAALVVNYGIENLRFNQPVMVNSNVRARFLMESALNLRGITKIRVKVTMEIEGNKKPAYEGSVLFLYHFKS